MIVQMFVSIVYKIHYKSTTFQKKEMESMAGGGVGGGVRELVTRLSR